MKLLAECRAFAARGKLAEAVSGAGREQPQQGGGRVHPGSRIVPGTR